MTFLVMSCLLVFMWDTIITRWDQGGINETLVQAMSTPPTKWGHALSENTVEEARTFFKTHWD